MNGAGGEFDIEWFVASDDGVDLRTASAVLDRWVATVPPGRRPEAGDIAELRGALDEAIALGAVNRATAAHLTFGIDVLQATAQFEAADWNSVLLAYFAQVRLDDAQWIDAMPVAQTLQALERGGATERLRIEDVPSTLLIALHDAGAIGALRELTTIVRRRAELCIERATTGAVPYGRWLLDLAALAVALEVRRFFPVSREAPRGPAATRPVADLTPFHPYAEALFAPDEIAAIRAADAELDRHEGDLLSAVTLNLITVDSLQRVADAFLSPAPADERTVRRAQLRSLCDRFRIPPVLFDALDAELAVPPRRMASGED